MTDKYDMIVHFPKTGKANETIEDKAPKLVVGSVRIELTNGEVYEWNPNDGMRIVERVESDQ